MAKGESTWSSKGKDVKKMSFEPLPVGWYDLKLGGPCEVRTAEGEGKFPRVGTRFAVVGTGENGQKDRLVFHDFFTRTEPNEKGIVLVEMGNQLVAFARGLGQEVSDAKTREVNGEVIIDPLWLKKWLENREGEVVRARLRIETDQNGEKRNRIAEFEEAEGESEEESGDEEPAAEEDDFKAALGKKGASKPAAKSKR